MNFAQLAIKALFVIVILYLLFLAGALILPTPSAFTALENGLLNFILFLLALLLLVLIGYLLGKGVKTVKKHVEVVILVLAAALIMGSVLVLYTILRVPYLPRVNLSWLGHQWYDPWLIVFLIGAPLMLIFLVGEW